MIESLLAFTSSYLNLMLISTMVSLGAIGILGVIGDRAYKIRTTVMMLPLVGGLVGELWQGTACFVHLFTSGAESIEHVLCNVTSYISMQANCTAWVIAIGVSISITGLVWFLNNHFSMSIVNKFSNYNYLQRDEAKQLYHRLDQLAQAAGIKQPNLRLIESSKPGIFSMGWGDKATIVLSVGLLETLSDEEVIACVAHEIVHCKNQDSRLKAIISSLRYSSLFNPIGLLLELKLNREMEFVADIEATQLTGDSNKLTSALINLSQQTDAEVVEEKTRSSYKISRKIKRIIFRVISKHPPVEERINRLLKCEL